MSHYEEAPRLAPGSRAEWRRWLEENHGSSAGVWLLIAKKGSGAAGLSYEDALEEALCFGWIDSRVRRLDERHFHQWYCPRHPGSIWSAPNKARLARLIEAGLMAPPGLAKIEAARADGSWEILDKVEALEVPDDLAAALAANPTAASGFAAMAPSERKQYLYWVLSAKRPDTRAKRIAALLEAAVGGPTPN
ncbi:MAG: YdeI/OmpD-associated family protein [Acidimicrobiia bacterium]|nr:YdeI/OmpD-associated family protein [Acidimicrobiia bacterium]